MVFLNVFTACPATFGQDFFRQFTRFVFKGGGHRVIPAIQESVQAYNPKDFIILKCMPLSTLCCFAGSIYRLHRTVNNCVAGGLDNQVHFLTTDIKRRSKAQRIGTAMDDVDTNMAHIFFG